MQVFAAVVLFVFSTLLLPHLWNRYMSGAPEIVERIVALVSVLSAVALLLSTDWAYVRISSPRRYPVGSALIVTGAVAAAAAAFWWFLVVSKPEPVCLGIMAIGSVAEFPPGAVVAGIRWRWPYSHVRLSISHTAKEDLQQIDFLVRPDLPVAEMRETKDSADVELSVEHDPTIQMELHRESGERFVLPLVHLASDVGRRLRCSRLAPRRRIEIVAAVVTFTEDDQTRHFTDKAYRLRLGFAEKGVWYGYDDAPDSIFAPRKLPKSILITGSYRCYGREHQVTQNVDVEDILATAAKKIREGQS